MWRKMRILKELGFMKEDVNKPLFDQNLHVQEVFCSSARALERVMVFF